MKTSTVILLMFSLYFAKAQNWCPPGATWHFEESISVTGGHGITEIKYTGDTVVGGKICKKIRRKRTFKKTMYFEYEVTHSSPFMIREYNGVLFFYSPLSTFDTIVDFNASIGDQWLVPRHKLNCESRLPLTVVDTGHVIVNGHTLRTVSTSYSAVSSSNMLLTHNNTFVERMLQTKHHSGSGCFLWLPFYCDEQLTSDCLSSAFRCYEDDLFGLYSTTTGECHPPLGIADQIANNGITVSPNPFSKQIVVNVTGKIPALQFRLLDVAGREFSYSKTEDIEGKIEITPGHLSPGIYFLHISTGSKPVVIRKIVKQ